MLCSQPRDVITDSKTCIVGKTQRKRTAETTLHTVVKRTKPQISQSSLNGELEKASIAFTPAEMELEDRLRESSLKTANVKEGLDSVVTVSDIRPTEFLQMAGVKG